MRYGVLNGKIAERGIQKSAIADALGVTAKTFGKKLSGRSPFTWPEVCVIQRRFFPDLDKDYLFTDTADQAG